MFSFKTSILKNFTLLLVISVTAIGHAQHTEYPIRFSSQNPFWELQSRQIEIQQANEFSGDNPNSVENIEGSPYANEPFAFGSLYVDAKLHKKNVLLRYNIFAEEIEISTGGKSKNSTYNALLKNPSFYARIGTATYIFAPYNESNKDGGYFEFLATGNHFDLYEKTKVLFIKATEPRPYAPSASAKFLRSIDFYLVSKSGKFFKIPNSHSKAVKEWDNDSDVLKTFLKKNDIDLSKKRDVLRTFNFYEALLSKAD
ncbi:MAG: hypothetical protein ACI86C_000469 [Candidatus Latescibacterota bacterium]